MKGSDLLKFTKKEVGQELGESGCCINKDTVVVKSLDRGLLVGEVAPSVNWYSLKLIP